MLGIHDCGIKNKKNRNRPLLIGYINNTTATSGAGIAYPSGTHAFTLVLCQACASQYLNFCVL